MSLWGDISKKWEEWKDHWEEQISRHRLEFKLTGAAVGGGVTGYIAGGPAGIPVGMSTAVAAVLKTEEINEIQRRREALAAASKELSQQPYRTEAEMRTASGIGAAGEIQITRGISQWLPVALVFVVVMYLIFKD